MLTDHNSPPLSRWRCWRRGTGCKPRVEPHNYYWPECDLETDHIKAKLSPRVLCRAVNTALNWMRVRS